MQQNIVWNKWNDFIFHEVSKNKISFFCILYYFIYIYFFSFGGGGAGGERERELWYNNDHPSAFPTQWPK